MLLPDALPLRTSKFRAISYLASAGLRNQGTMDRAVLSQISLVMMWKYAVITYLRKALEAVLTYHLAPERLKQLLTFNTSEILDH